MQVSDVTKIKQYYQALLDRDESFLGSFFVGVKTTGIFCLPTCRARKPKLENVNFYTDFKEALLQGYRPCKICKPTQNANDAPVEVTQAIELVKANPKQKISDYMLRQANISPEMVRRWFKKQYGMTFHTYQRMYRINIAYQELKNGKKTTDSAFDAGYESLSGFGYTFKKLLGKSPKNGGSKQVLLLHRFSTPIGGMFACASDRGLCLLEFVDRRMLETEFKDLQRRLNATIFLGKNEHIQQAKSELGEYFVGKRTKFKLTLHTPGTEFQQSVWQALEEIPYGETRSYQEQALKLNKPNAVRSVARANGFNRIAIIIPCHRVIGKDGNLTGYGGGLERKKWLLDHEKKNKP